MKWRYCCWGAGFQPAPNGRFPLCLCRSYHPLHCRSPQPSNCSVGDGLARPATDCEAPLNHPPILTSIIQSCRRGRTSPSRKGLRSVFIFPSALPTGKLLLDSGAAAKLRRVFFLFVVAVLISKTRSISPPWRGARLRF